MNQKLVFQSLRRVNSTTKIVLFLLLIVSFSLTLITPAQAQATGAITGVVFEDLNFNDTLDLYEAKLADWQVNLYQDNELIKNTLTDSSGKYYFGDLQPGDYRLEIEIPNTWVPVKAKEFLVSLQADQKAEVNFANYQIIRAEKEGVEPMLLISNTQIQVFSPTSIKITWFTTHPATSQIVFGKISKANNQLSLTDNNLGYLFATAIDFETKTFHSMTLTDLKPQTTYYFRVVSLPNPKQWRGAPRIFSSEIGLTTGTLPAEKPTELKPSLPTEPKKPVKPALPTQVQKEILAEEFKEPAGEVIESTSTEEVVVEELKEEKPAEEKEEKPQANCALYIWLLLVLNAIALGFLRFYGRQYKKGSLQRQLWPTGLIFVALPTIIWYPECGLIIWLLITLILMIVYLSMPKKRKPKPIEPPPPSPQPPLPTSTHSNSETPSEPISSTPISSSVDQPSQPASLQQPTLISSPAEKEESKK